MNFPSHATSSVNQVANAYSGNPQALQQRTQNGVTPELIDLLALQKVKAEKDAAARQMAMANNQQMPTVAEGLEQSAMQSARSEIAQKLGLPSLLNQGQNIAQPQGAPQGAPGMPMQAPPQGAQGMPPQGPVVRAAAGGLMRIPSNLPQSYAGGGIIAFTNEGYVEPAQKDEQEELKTDRSWLTKKLQEFGYAAQDIAAMPIRVATAIVNAGIVRPARAVTNSEIPYIPMLGGEASNFEGSLTPYTDRAYKERQKAQAQEIPIASYSNEGREPPSSASIPPVAAPTVGKPPPANVSGATRPAAAPAYTPPPFPVAQPGFAEMNTAVQKGLTAGLAIDPAKSRADAMKEYKDMFGAHQDAAVSAQQKGLADLVAAQEAEKAGRPDKFLGIFNRAGLAALDPTSLTPWKKVSGAVEEERQGFAKKDEANVMVRNTLTTAMHEAIAKNDASLYAAGKEAAVEALRAKGMALSDAVKYVDSQARTLEAAQANWQTNETRRQAMASAAADRAASKQNTDDMKKLALSEKAQQAVSAELEKNMALKMLKMERDGILKSTTQPSPAQLQKITDIDAKIKEETNRVYAPFLQYGVFNPYATQAGASAPFGAPPPGAVKKKGP